MSGLASHQAEQNPKQKRILTQTYISNGSQKKRNYWLECATESHSFSIHTYLPATLVQLWSTSLVVNHNHDCMRLISNLC